MGRLVWTPLIYAFAFLLLYVPHTMAADAPHAAAAEAGVEATTDVHVDEATDTAIDPANAHAEAVEAAPHHGEHESSGGLPQFDPTSFPSQLFWLVITFAVLYTFFSKKTLPQISSVIGTRENKIRSDLELARTLKTQAEDVQNAYEASLKNARDHATQSFMDGEKAIKDKSNKAYAEFQQRATEQTKALEKSIEKAKAEAMENMSTLAAEIASQAAEKIIGVETDIDKARSVVKSIHSNKAKAA